NKQVSHGDKPGEYFIDLTVKGKGVHPIPTTDIVIVYDNSNSMEKPMENGKTRAVNAKEATTTFLNGLADGSGTRFALVTYGSSIFDGVMNQTWANNPGVTANHSYKQFTNDPGNILNQLPSLVPSDNGHAGKTWHGGTFTQQALVEAGNILATSNADRKSMVTVTDGAPTLRFVSGNSGSITGDVTSFVRAGGGNHGTPTINTANGLKSNYEMYAIGLGLGEGDGEASAQDVRNVVNGISTSEGHAYMADTVQEMVDALNDIAGQLQTNYVVDGSIDDPITEQFILEDDWYELTASDDSLKEGIIVTVKNGKVTVDGLNLGHEQWVNVRYKVQFDTDNYEWEANKLYPTNGTTTLTPKGDDPDNKHEFPEPEASTVPVEVSGQKIWIDYGIEDYRPDKITVQLIREINGEDVIVAEKEVKSNGTNK